MFSTFFNIISISLKYTNTTSTTALPLVFTFVALGSDHICCLLRSRMVCTINHFSLNNLYLVTHSNTFQPVYDDVDLEDMNWDSLLSAYVYQCPCGDLFQITPTELRAGDEIARCPSCTLVVRVVYDPDDLSDNPDSEAAWNIKCLAEETH